MKLIFSLFVAGAIGLNLNVHEEKLQLSHLKCYSDRECQSGEKCFASGQGYGVCTASCFKDS